ncbi:hypothetical protein ACFYO5_35375 [Streptomyces sp. NPDC006259]|uniref:hypothetical protein n=1 Tax=Streptomyces sp. NPDC006259 TaxID=3364740 RepID=UPI003694A0D1
MNSTSLPHRRPLRTLCLLTVVTAAALSGCTNDGKPAHDGPTSAPPTSAPPRGVVTRAEADEMVLVIAPLAHKQESLVRNSGLPITPGKTESVYNRTPRALVADQFQGETVVHLPLQGKPEILDYRYAMVGSR